LFKLWVSDISFFRQHLYSKTEAVSVLDGPARAELLMQKRLLEDRTGMTIGKLSLLEDRTGRG
jgi:hypothetical protein